MPDEEQLFLHPAEPHVPNRTRDDLYGIYDDLELIKKQLAQMPTLKQLCRFGVWVALGLCVAALIGVQMWWRWVWACSLL